VISHGSSCKTRLRGGDPANPIFANDHDEDRVCSLRLRPRVLRRVLTVAAIGRFSPTIPAHVVFPPLSVPPPHALYLQCPACTRAPPEATDGAAHAASG